MIASLSRGLLASVFAGLCLGWVVLVHAVYLVAMNDGQFLDANGGPTLLWFLPTLIVPLGLLLGLWQLKSRGCSPAVFGAVSGVTVGLWLNAVLLTVPYLGLYPNLPTLLLGVAVSGGGGVDAGPPFFLPILAANPLFWGVVGWLTGRSGTR